MARATISGLTVTIGADTKQFSDAMKQIDAEARNISKDLKTVNESLKLDPNNLSKSVTSLKLLQEQSQKAGEKVKLIQDSINKLNKEYSAGKVSSEDYTKSMDHLQMLLSQATHEQDLTNEKIRQFGQDAEEAGQSATSLGDIIKGNLIADLIQSGLQKVASLAKDLASAVVGAIKDIAKAIWDFTKDSVSIAEENKQTLAKVGQVFEENAQQIIDWSKTAVDSFGLSSGKAQEASAVFGNMFRALGIGTEEAADMSMSMVQLAADIAAFNNTTTSEVLEDFQSMLAGTSRTVRKYGIVLTEAAVKQKAVDMGLAETTDDVGDAEKAVARYTLMLEQTTHQAGQFARESSSATVQTQKLRARVEELQGEIGEKLLPIQAEFYKQLNDFLASDSGRQLFQGITEAVGELADAVIKFINEGHLAEWFEGVKEKVPEVVEWVQNFATQVSELVPKIGELIEYLLNLFGIETEASRAKEAYKGVKEEIEDLAVKYNASSETIRTAVAMFAEENGISISKIYGDWATYEPQIEQYLSQLQSDYNSNLLDGAYDIIQDFADQNLLSMQDIYNNWAYWEPQIISYVQSLGTDYDTEFGEAYRQIQQFATDNGLTLGEVLSDWGVYEPQIKTWMDTLATDATNTEQAVGNALEQMPEKAQQSVNKFGSINWTSMDAFREKVRGWAHDIIGWFKEVANLSNDPSWQTDQSLIDQSTPDYLYGPGSWTPSNAEGGPVKAGKMYRVNDDAGRRNEYFIPSTNGYILNGNQTDRIVNNSSSQNFSGGIQIYVNSYGMNVAEVADELGAAFANKIRMSGAMI